MAWRSVESLKKLRAQVMEKWPEADPKEFGTIGDEAHQATTSDHNPEPDGTVDALDIPHQPEIGLDTYKLADQLLASRDKRIKYIISNSRIGGDEEYGRRNNQTPWEWHPYHGANPHDHHMHISVNDEGQDDTTPWKFGEEETEVDWEHGKGSWYSQYQGKYPWIDRGDGKWNEARTVYLGPDNALGVPDEAQGIAFYDRATLGEWFEVHYPNGHVSYEQQTDVGPNPKTGRTIDISAAAAERAGYNPDSFPTDSVIYWKATNIPEEVANLSPKEQAIAYYKLRRPSVPPVEPVKPKPKPIEVHNIDEAFAWADTEQARISSHLKRLMLEMQAQPPPQSPSEWSELIEELKPVVFANMGTLLPILSQLNPSTIGKLVTLGLAQGFGPVKATEIPMDSTKGWLQSKTIWGVAMMALPALAQAFGYHVTGDDVSAIVSAGSAILEAVGAILAIVGRVTAKTSISASPVVKN